MQYVGNTTSTTTSSSEREVVVGVGKREISREQGVDSVSQQTEVDNFGALARLLLLELCGIGVRSGTKRA